MDDPLQVQYAKKQAEPVHDSKKLLITDIPSTIQVSPELLDNHFFNDIEVLEIQVQHDEPFSTAIVSFKESQGMILSCMHMISYIYIIHTCNRHIYMCVCAYVLTWHARYDTVMVHKISISNSMFGV